MRRSTAPLEHETARLKLRQLREADLDAYAAMMADAEVVKYLGDGKPVDRPNAWRSMAAILGHWTLRGFGFWALEEKATGALVGRGGLWFPEGWPQLEVGWTLQRSAWGKGYATEVGRAALELAFSRGLDEVCSVIMPQNVRSIRVAQRLGETLAGSARVQGFDCALYKVTRERFTTLQQAPSPQSDRRTP
jgi:RimJ/RimL family protein N-acetyltransferase